MRATQRNELQYFSNYFWPFIYSLEVADWENCRGLHPLCPADCLDIQDPICGESRTQLCPDDCLELYKPVCGSDGQVYLNECFLRKENCDNGIEKVDMSECAVASKCPSFCIPIYDPVCGSNKKIYLNRCQMLKENCNSTKIKNMPLQFCVGEDDVHKI
ncbi:Agrin-like protein 5 [Sarcoptes scabiei]|uniref:Agrin-like protein 5 n=1 Tax=Sarcoptes scabiei TaxID=52283 RepID=A0A132AHH8_SARSC|nr:Agrin-like protein 5 [Sarcoptes scabiei]